MTIQQLNAALDGGQTDLGEINKKLNALIEEEEKQLNAEEEKPAEEPQVKPEEPDNQPQAEPGEAAKESQEEKKELAAVESIFAELTEKLEKLSADNARLQAKLEAKEKAEQDFIARFKNLSVSLSTESVTEVPEESDEQNVFTDGIGEF